MVLLIFILCSYDLKLTNFPTGIYLVTLPENIRVQFTMRCRESGYVLTFDVKLGQGPLIICACRAVRFGMEVWLTLKNRHLKFFKWPGAETLATILDKSVNNFKSEKDLLKLASDEYNVFRQKCWKNINWFGQWLDQYNCPQILCDHDQRRKPLPPPWYRSLLGYKFKSYIDIYEEDLNLNTLFRDSSGEDSEESGETSPPQPPH